MQINRLSVVFKFIKKEGLKEKLETNVTYNLPVNLLI